MVEAQAYTPQQVRSILEACGVRIGTESHSNWFCFCPWHWNDDTPALSVSKYSGLYMCFNPACAVRGNLLQLVTKLTKRNLYEAARFISNAETDEPIRFEEPFEWQPYSQERIDRLHDAFWDSPGHRYMRGRQFKDEVLRKYKVGWSEKRQMVCIPVVQHEGMLVGMLARSIHEKKFHLTKGIPKNKLLFNLNRAKAYDSVIVVEASFDVLRLDQAGFPNGVATLGGNISPEHIELLNRHFVKLTNFLDNDESGKALAAKLTQRFEREVWHAQHYDGLKDPGMMTDEQIEQSLKEKRSDFDLKLESMLY